MTKIVAHRGAWKEFDLTENSIPALKKAIEIGCAGSECDVWMTKDGRFVVHHDADFLGMKINKTKYAALQNQVGQHHLQIPLLTDFIQIIHQQAVIKTKLLIELKLADDVCHDTVFSTVKQLSMLLQKETKPKFFSLLLFDLKAALLFKKIHPEFFVSYLNGDIPSQKIQESGLDGVDYHYSVYVKEDYLISSFKEQSLHVNSWTVNDIRIAENLIAQGADWITTDEPFICISNGL